MSEPFRNQTAIISGGLGDIGRAVACEFARQGAVVAIGDRRPLAAAEPFLEQLCGLRPRCRYDTVDVADAAMVMSWVESVEQDLGPATLVVPNAAIVTLAGFCEVTPEQWSRELRVNLDGAFHMAQAAALRMIHHRRSGHIVFLGSWAAHRPHPHIPAYSVAKAGLRMLVQCMALELAPRGIQVNEVAPGYVDAGLSKQVWDQNPPLRHDCLHKVPLQRLISPEEVARQVALLCHPDNRQMTGSVVVMDGGLSLLS